MENFDTYTLYKEFTIVINQYDFPKEVMRRLLEIGLLKIDSKNLDKFN